MILGGLAGPDGRCLGIVSASSSTILSRISPSAPGGMKAAPFSWKSFCQDASTLNVPANRLRISDLPSGVQRPQATRMVEIMDCTPNVLGYSRRSNDGPGRSDVRRHHAPQQPHRVAMPRCEAIVSMMRLSGPPHHVVRVHIRDRLGFVVGVPIPAKRERPQHGGPTALPQVVHHKVVVPPRASLALGPDFRSDFDCMRMSFGNPFHDLPVPGIAAPQDAQEVSDN